MADALHESSLMLHVVQGIFDFDWKPNRLHGMLYLYTRVVSNYRRRQERIEHG